MFTSTPYMQALDNHLTLKSLQNEGDLDRLAAFNGQIFGPELAGLTRRLVLEHPGARPDYWLYIEDDQSQQIVSSLCLIPWTWRYEDVTLKGGEMGIVGTLEAYRNRGLIRALAARHKALLVQDDFDLSPIQGIPYFYRQFGYEYALPLEASWSLDLHRIPDDTESAYTFRRATIDDLPTLRTCYEDAARGLAISAVRGEALWRYLLADAPGTAVDGEFWLVIDGEAKIAGYWRIMREGFGTGLIISEASRMQQLAALAVLAFLKGVAAERGKPGIRFNLPVSSDVLGAARGWGAADTGTYQWQIMLVDPARLLRKLAPVLERRLAASRFAGLSQRLILNLYREAFELHFDGGNLAGVEKLGFREEGEFRLPPNLLVPLVLGWRTREQLAAFYPDVSVWGQTAELVDVLFPRVESFIFAGY